MYAQFIRSLHYPDDARKALINDYCNLQNLQHVGAMLFHPHRKTALNEIRKLNKSLSFRTFQFDNNVMSKTFKR